MSNQPEAPKPETMDLRALIIDAMRDAWNDICSDINCHPDDISHEGRRLFFEPGHWASQTADIVASKIEAVSAALSAKPETDFETLARERYGVTPYGSERDRIAAACRHAFVAGAQAAHTALLARLAEVERERDSEEPGTPLGRLKAISDYAVSKNLHSPAAAKPAEVSLIEAYEKVERERDKYERIIASISEEYSLCRDLLVERTGEKVAAETALATAQGLLADADAVIAYVNDDEVPWSEEMDDKTTLWLDEAKARHKARAAGKGTDAKAANTDEAR